jgi:antitoxin component of RelBE/YafQ-DinJ toxin-antitoxin module
MESKNITLRVKSDLYEKYKKLCKKKGLLISRQFEIMMEKYLREEDKNGKRQS